MGSEQEVSSTAIWDRPRSPPPAADSDGPDSEGRVDSFLQPLDVEDTLELARDKRWRFNARKAVSVRERTAVLFESGFNILDQHLALSLRQRADVEEEAEVVVEAKAYAGTYSTKAKVRQMLKDVARTEHKFVHKPGAEPPPPPPLPPPDPPSTSSSSPEPERPHKPRRPLLDLPIRPRFIKPSGPRVLGFGSAAAKSTATTEAVYAAARASPTANMGKPTLATRRSSSAGASGRPLEIPHGVRSVTSAAGGSRASPSIPDTSASDPVTTQLLLQGGGVEEAEQQLHPTASLQLQLEGHTEQQGAGDVGASADTQTAAAASLSGLQLSGLAGNGAPGLLGVGWVTKGQPVPSAVSTQAAAPAAAGLQTGPAVVVSIQVGGAIQGGGGGGGERGPLQHRGGLGILPRVLAEAIEPSARRAALLQAASSLALQHSEAHSPGRSVNQAVGGMPAPLAPPTLLFNNATSSHIGGPLQQQAASSDQQQGQTGGHSISTSTIEISELRSSREAVQCLEAGLAQTSTETPGSSTATGTPNNSSTSTASCSTLGSGQTSAPSLLQGCGLTKSSAPVMLQPGAQGQPSSSVASGSRSLDTMPLKATDAAQGGPTLSPGAFSHHLNLASPKQHKQLPLPQHHHRQSQPAVAFSSTEGVGSSVRFGRRAPPRHSSSAASLSVVGSLPNGSACSTAAPTGSNYGAAPTITTVSPAGAGIPANARAQGVNGAGPVGLGGSSTSPAVRPLPTAPAGTSAVAPGLSGQGMYGMLVGAVRETNTGPSSTPLLSKGPPGQHQPAAASGISSGPPGSAGPSGALLLGGLGGKGSGAVRRRSVGDYVDLPAAAAQLQQRLHELGGAPGSSQQYNPTPAHQQQYTHSPPLPRRRAAQQGGGGAVLGHATYAHPLLLSLASSSSYRPPMLGLMFAPAAGMPGQS